MKGHEFRYLKSAIQSLVHSTRVSFTTSELDVGINGRCSPYISHQSVVWESTLASQMWIPGLRISNGRYTIILASSSPQYAVVDEGEKGMAEFIAQPHEQLVEGWVPAVLFEGLLTEAERYGVSLYHGKLLWVGFAIGRVISWEEDGRPIFQPALHEEAMPAEYLEEAIS